MQQHVALKSPAQTPTKSPTKRTMMITEAQKQALMDNLQLEVTERARKLRAQYALQAQSLRTRIELRINRIPHSLRKANMGELCQKYQETKKQAAPEAVSSEHEFDKQPAKGVSTKGNTKPAASPRPKGVKRTSEQMENADKENTPDPAQNLPNPKKRTKTAATAPSRQVTNPSTVLSPKSSNPRNLPQSPVRPTLGSPQKQHLSRPVSPLKPLSPSKQFTFAKPFSPAKSAAIAATSHLADMVAEKPKATRGKATAGRKAAGRAAQATKATSTRSKRGMEPPAVPELRTVSSQSTTSTTSNATTVIKKSGKAHTAITAAAQKKKAPNAGGSAAVQKVADAPPAGRRVLRKRA